jgi:hypothetical protein
MFLSVTNALAYTGTASVTTAKRFVEQTPELKKLVTLAMYEGLLFFQIKLTPKRSIMALNIMTLCTTVKEAAHGVSATLSVSLGLMSWRAKNENT